MTDHICMIKYILICKTTQDADIVSANDILVYKTEIIQPLMHDECRKDSIALILSNIRSAN